MILTARKTPYTFAEERVLKQIENDVKNGRLNEEYTLDDSFANAVANHSYGLELEDWELNGEELYAVFYGDVGTLIKETEQQLLLAERGV